MTNMRWLVGWLAALVMTLLSQTALAGPSFPNLTGRVVDQAEILSPDTETSLTAKLQDLETRTGHQVVVVTVNSLEGLSIDDYGIVLGRRWGVGRKNANDGVLLIVAPKQRQMRIEVGYGLESALTNDEAAAIIADDMAPQFKAGDFDRGVTAGADAIISQIETPQPAAAATGAAAPIGQATPAAAPVGSLSMSALLLIFLVVGVLVWLLGGKQPQLVYAPNPALTPPPPPGWDPSQGPAPPATPLAQPDPVPAAAKPQGPLDKLMHTTIGEAISGTLGKSMGPGLIPGLLVGAGAGAGGVLLANRIHSGSWFPGRPDQGAAPADTAATPAAEPAVAGLAAPTPTPALPAPAAAEPAPDPAPEAKPEAKPAADAGKPPPAAPGPTSDPTSGPTSGPSSGDAGNW